MACFPLLLFLPVSCALLDPAPSASPVPPSHLRPVVAVTDFENRAGFNGKWSLGDGMAEVMINELLETDRVIVLERKHINDVLGEVLRQGKALFRKEGRVEPGRLKNVRYLIRGVVSDFHVNGDKSGWFASSRGGLRAWGTSARVTLHVYVTDVETGQIIGSVEETGTASRFGFGGGVKYQDLAFGGDAYFRTPLGRATQEAAGRAANQILDLLPERTWEGRVASGGPDLVVINGGENVRMQVGERLLVRGEGRKITDPVTGDVIEEMPGPVIGKIRVESVDAQSSRAVLLEGRAERGDFLERLR